MGEPGMLGNDGGSGGQGFGMGETSRVGLLPHLVRRFATRARKKILHGLK